MFSGEGMLPTPSHNWMYHTTLPKPHACSQAEKRSGLGQGHYNHSPFPLVHCKWYSHFGKQSHSFLGNETYISAVRKWKLENGQLQDSKTVYQKQTNNNKNQGLSGDGLLQGNCLADATEWMHIWAHRDCSSFPKPAQVQDRRVTAPSQGGRHRVSLLTKELPASKENIIFFQWSLTGFINHTLGQAPPPRVGSQHKTKFILLYVYVFYSIGLLPVSFAFYFSGVFVSC